MKKVIGNEAALADWLEAERQMSQKNASVQPKGSVTVDQYAALKNLRHRTAADRLYHMFRAGIVVREKWGNFYVYFPLKKK